DVCVREPRRPDRRDRRPPHEHEAAGRRGHRVRRADAYGVERHLDGIADELHVRVVPLQRERTRLHGDRRRRGGNVHRRSRRRRSRARGSRDREERRLHPGRVQPRHAADRLITPAATGQKRRMARSRRRHGHRQSFGELVDLWVDLFKQHNLLTYASAIAFQSLVALVALLLLGLAVLGSIGRTDVWNEQIAPHIATKVLPPVYAGIDAIAQKVFSSSSVGLIVFASVVTVWEMSGVVRACMGAIAEIYDTEEDRSWKI